MILRLLGAKVGKRIYWPGSGIEGLVEYDLLEVGDDVVFGCGPRRGSPGFFPIGRFAKNRHLVIVQHDSSSNYSCAGTAGRCESRAGPTWPTAASFCRYMSSWFWIQAAVF
mmetsp:Transcript_37274/g.99245  ORF Transcript_37274/g.99245 Transcript_37274/m.99245 type:complete len:111 (-) Transcript_37274:216-548(-)